MERAKAQGGSCKFEKKSCSLRRQHSQTRSSSILKPTCVVSIHSRQHLFEFTTIPNRPVSILVANMVQYYSIFGAKVGSHYVSPCAIPIAPRRPGLGPEKELSVQQLRISR